MHAQVDRLSHLPLMSEEEFDRWCDEDTRAEFVDGKVLLMSPVSLTHNELNGFLAALLRLYLELRPSGKLLGPEYAVRLRAGLRRVPDLLYISPEHLDRISETVFEGAPDVAWEIISPESEARDWREKYHEYEEAGVREYWIINPYVKTVWLSRLNAQGHYESVEPVDDQLASEVVPGFWLRPEWLWRQPQPKVFDCLRELGVFPA
jgi:Uma2 family endonuclease